MMFSKDNEQACGYLLSPAAVCASGFHR